MLESRTIAIKQNVRFQERMHLVKIRLDQIKNGRLSAIIHFHMADIYLTHEFKMAENQYYLPR